MEKKMVKFKIKDGHPKMSVIYGGVKYVLVSLDKLPDDVFKYAMKNNIYGIVKVKEENKDGKHNSRSE